MQAAQLFRSPEETPHSQRLVVGSSKFQTYAHVALPQPKQPQQSAPLAVRDETKQPEAEIRLKQAEDQKRIQQQESEPQQEVKRNHEKKSHRRRHRRRVGKKKSGTKGSGAKPTNSRVNLMKSSMPLSYGSPNPQLQSAFYNTSAVGSKNYIPVEQVKGEQRYTTRKYTGNGGYALVKKDEDDDVTKIGKTRATQNKQTDNSVFQQMKDANVFKPTSRAHLMKSHMKFGDDKVDYTSAQKRQFVEREIETRKVSGSRNALMRTTMVLGSEPNKWKSSYNTMYADEKQEDATRQPARDRSQLLATTMVLGMEKVDYTTAAMDQFAPKENQVRAKVGSRTGLMRSCIVLGTDKLSYATEKKSNFHERDNEKRGAVGSKLQLMQSHLVLGTDATTYNTCTEDQYKETADHLMTQGSDANQGDDDDDEWEWESYYSGESD